MLNPKELTTLLNLLSEEEKTFDSISQNFTKAFNKSEQFKLGCTLHFVLEENLLRPTTHRLAAFYILYDLYKGEPISHNPFFLVFVEGLQKQCDPAEKQFLNLLLHGSVKEVCLTWPLFFKLTAGISSSSALHETSWRWERNSLNHWLHWIRLF